ncbi:hypothetical protein H4S14_002061 [Agrobacterium vitis]|nr:hypothetical protein [Agrobacterium vitis]MBE1438314.1 hypothetical protein [Agrobacterium vitis]
MSGPSQLERWALERAHKIMLNEGMSLVNAAQWLDKKQTIKSSQQLRDAIRQSLLEALTFQSATADPKQGADVVCFSPPSTETFSVEVDSSPNITGQISVDQYRPAPTFPSSQP